MSEHIFDILGVGGREDSYTDLIAHAFNTSQKFRVKLIENIGINDYGDWISHVRLPVSIKSDTGRKKDIPDLIFSSKTGNKIVLIENKIFSGEGWEQTKRYSSNEFKDSLVRYLIKKNILQNGMVPNFKFFYLTLDGNNPSSSEFIPIKYTVISEAIPHDADNSKLTLLLNELKDRIDEYNNWQLPKDNELVIDYLKSARRLVSPYKVFCKLADGLVSNDNDFIKEFYLTGNQGSSYIPSCQWHKAHWISKRYPIVKDGSKCYEINIGLQWDILWDTLALRLDYHTSPYMIQKKLKELDEEFQLEFQEARKNLFNYIKERNLAGWEMKLNPIKIAHFSFNEKLAKITFSELRDEVEMLTADMEEVLDEWLGIHV